MVYVQIPKNNSNTIIIIQGDPQCNRFQQYIAVGVWEQIETGEVLRVKRHRNKRVVRNGTKNDKLHVCHHQIVRSGASSHPTIDSHVFSGEILCFQA